MNYSGFALKTNRLELKAMDKKYTQDIYVNFTEETTKYMYPKAPKEISETEAFVANQTAKNEKGIDIGFVITKGADGEFLGCGGLHGANKAVPELGIWVKKAAHGMGYGREAMRGIAEWAVKNLPHVEGILYPVDFANLQSRKIPESMGGRIVGKCDETNMSESTLHLAVYFIDAKVFRENIS